MYIASTVSIYDFYLDYEFNIHVLIDFNVLFHLMVSLIDRRLKPLY